MIEVESPLECAVQRRIFGVTISGGEGEGNGGRHTPGDESVDGKVDKNALQTGLGTCLATPRYASANQGGYRTSEAQTQPR